MLVWGFLGSVSKDFTKDGISLNGTAYDISVDDSLVGKEDTLNIHKYLMV